MSSFIAHNVRLTILSRLRIFLSILTLLFVMLTPTSYAGSLDAFEDSVEKNPKSNGGNGRGDSCQSNELNFGCLVVDVVSDVVYHIVVFGGTYSFYRVDHSPHHFFISDDIGELDGISLRLAGEPLIPFARLDLSYQHNDPRTKAYDYRFEAGYGALALGYNQTRYRERAPNDSLALTRIYGLFRMSFGSHVEVDWGVGSLEVDGNEHRSLLYITTPILVHLSRRIGFEFRPSWAGNISDYDMAILLKSKYAAIKLGYRKLSAGTESLNGPYAGLSVHY